MIPEDIQHLRELERWGKGTSLSVPEYLRRDGILWQEVRAVLPELLDDWERMRGALDRTNVLLNAADSYLSLVYSRYRRTPLPDDVVEEMQALVSNIRAQTGARGT